MAPRLEVLSVCQVGLKAFSVIALSEAVAAALAPWRLGASDGRPRFIAKIELVGPRWRGFLPSATPRQGRRVATLDRRPRGATSRRVIAGPLEVFG